MKYYAVRKGRTTGIFESWDQCRQQVTGFSGAEYKSFASEEEAMRYLKKAEEKHIDAEAPYAFVDGSYNPKTGVYGYGGFLVQNGEQIIIQGSGSDPEMASMRNVAGEVLGATAAIEKAIFLGLKSLTIYYDYAGVEAWATGDWKRNQSGTKKYHSFVQIAKNMLDLKFVKVKGHSGIEENEEADRLAKEAVGI